MVVAAPAVPSIGGMGAVYLVRFQGLGVEDGGVSIICFEEPEVDLSGVVGDVKEFATLVPSVSELVVLPPSVTADG